MLHGRGILSPNINELSESLSQLPIGCCCGNTVVNHMMYADDIVFHQQRDCKILSMYVMHMVVIMILYLIYQNHK